jgi:hypothetical protein
MLSLIDRFGRTTSRLNGAKMGLARMKDAPAKSLIRRLDCLQSRAQSVSGTCVSFVPHRTAHATGVFPLGR